MPTRGWSTSPDWWSTSRIIQNFYSLIDLLQTQYDVEYKECFKINIKEGRLVYYPWAYPYGGITGLITFIKSFNCKPTFLNDGTGSYKVELLENGDFKIINGSSPG